MKQMGLNLAELFGIFILGFGFLINCFETSQAQTYWLFIFISFVYILFMKYLENRLNEKKKRIFSKTKMEKTKC